MNREPSPAHRPRVLVAEDDTNMRELVADILRKDGLEVQEIPDGRTLMRLVEASRSSREGAAIDLIVSDVRMPFCSGLDVLERIRLTGCATEVLLMTAFGEQSLRARVRALGGRLLDKPFALRALREAVRELLCAATAPM
jgi:DNA-binding response OmpR family regulator